MKKLGLWLVAGGLALLGMQGLVAGPSSWLWGSDSEKAGKRGTLAVPYKDKETQTAPVVGQLKLYGESHALVIGINQYDNGWPRLSNAVADARAVAKALEVQGFQVVLLDTAVF